MRSFDEFDFFVGYGRSKFVSDDFYGCDSVEFIISFYVYQPFPILLQRFISFLIYVENWALLWNTFLVGRNVRGRVFLNSFDSSGRQTSFRSLPQCLLVIWSFAFGPNAQNASLLIWYTVCSSKYSIFWFFISSEFLW